MLLKGKTAVIAGGANGIGRAAAQLFAKEGAHVVIGDINEKDGQKVVQDITIANNKAKFVKSDVSNWEEVKNLLEVTATTFGIPSILFSSVSIYARCKTADTEIDLWDRMMAVNVRSSFLLCKGVIPYMQSAGGGSIILTSSSVGWHDAAPNIAAYATSKFAITGLTKAAACDYLHDNIRVNCLCPGPTDTPMIRNSRSADELKDFVNNLPIKRLAQPSEIAAAALFLASDESAYITGVALPVDGGQTAFV